MNQILPGAWQRLTLNEVLDMLPSGSQVQQGWSPQCEKEAAQAHEWGVLKTTAIQPGAFLPEHNKRLPSHLQPREALEVVTGDVLLTNAGPRSRCAVPCLVRQTRPRLMLSGKFYRFRPQPDLLDPRFLELYLLSPEAQAALDAMKTGISDSGLNLTRGRFLGLAMPVPPLDEQRRIVEILEDHLSRLDAAFGLSKSAERRARAMRQAWLKEKFGNPSPNEVFAVSDVLLEWRGGWSRGRRHEVADGAGAPYLKMNNISPGGDLVLDDVTFVNGTPEAFAKFSIKTGDILFNSKNSGDLVGKTAVADDRVAGWTFNENIMRLRFSPQLDPQFLWLWFQGPLMRRAVRQGTAATTNVAAVYMHQLRNAPVWVPSRGTQGALVTEFAGLAAPHRRLIAEIEKIEKRTTRLRRSLLIRAFTGSLTSSMIGEVRSA